MFHRSTLIAYLVSPNNSDLNPFLPTVPFWKNEGFLMLSRDQKGTLGRNGLITASGWALDALFYSYFMSET